MAGFPLWRCAALGREAMAELLLKRGANPNVHAVRERVAGLQRLSPSPARDDRSLHALRRHLVGADIAGLYRETDRLCPSDA